MASVNVYSAEHVDELTDGAVTGAAITSGHLILQLGDGSTVDVGSIVTNPPVATDSVEGVVELATDTETVTGTDSTRAVTPLGLAALVATLNTVKTASGLAETALPTSYPVGYSIMSLSSSSWSLSSGSGTVLTNYIDTNHCTQTFHANSGGTQAVKVWTRQYHSSNGGGGWTAWEQVLVLATLTPGSFTQTTTFTSYPAGYSRLYYTSANGGSWDFTGNAGEVITYVDGTDFARQTFTKHVGGSSGITEEWVRTANSTTGWTPWRRIVTAAADSGNPKAMAWGTVSITPVANTVTTLAVVFPTGRFSTTPTNVQVTANSGLPGTSITEVCASNVTATGMDISLYRTNATATFIWWLAIL